MIQEAELINLILSVLLFTLFIVVYRKSRLEISVYIMLALVFLILAEIFTIAEGFLLEQQFNFLEHLFYLLASAGLLLGLWKHYYMF